MMNHTDGWMSRWAGGGNLLWAVLGLGLLALLVILVLRLARK